MPKAIRRLIGLVGLLTLVSMVTFGAMNFLGDPLFNILGPVAADVDNPESLKLLRKRKLNTTWINRYLNDGRVGLGIL